MLQGKEEWKNFEHTSKWEKEHVFNFISSDFHHDLNRFLPLIKSLIALCPLLGLLGTVTGMIEVFDIMAATGTGNPRAMASGVSKATIPTMAGMVAALSGIYFSAQLNRFAKNKTQHFQEYLR